MTARLYLILPASALVWHSAAGALRRPRFMKQFLVCCIRVFHPAVVHPLITIQSHPLLCPHERSACCVQRAGVHP